MLMKMRSPSAGLALMQATDAQVRGLACAYYVTPLKFRAWASSGVDCPNEDAEIGDSAQSVFECQNIELRQLYTALGSKAEAILHAMLIVTNMRMLQSMQSIFLLALTARASHTQRRA